MRYYISGSITKTKNFKEVFKQSEDSLHSLGADDVFNPATSDLKIPYSEKTKGEVWKPYMKYDLKMLVDVDGLVLLPGLELIARWFLGIRVATFKRLVKELRNGNS
jgi:hypothetical protein